MNEMTLNWDDLKLFLAVARLGGLSAAANATGKSAPTLGRRMLALESVVGKELFLRLPRGYELTDQGTAFLAKIVDLEAQIAPFEKTKDAKGRVLVKISAGSWVTHFLCENASAILEGNKSTQLRFISAEHVLNIAHREAVIGIRNQRPEQNGLACRKLGRVQFAVYAKNKGIRPWIKVMANTPSARWLVAQEFNASVVEVTAPRNALDLAIAGVGRAVLPTFIGNAQPELTLVSKTIPELSHDQWLVTHQEDRFLPEVRSAIDKTFQLLNSLHRRTD